MKFNKKRFKDDLITIFYYMYIGVLLLVVVSASSLMVGLMIATYHHPKELSPVWVMLLTIHLLIIFKRRYFDEVQDDEC